MCRKDVRAIRTARSCRGMPHTSQLEAWYHRHARFFDRDEEQHTMRNGDAKIETDAQHCAAAHRFRIPGSEKGVLDQRTMQGAGGTSGRSRGTEGPEYGCPPESQAACYPPTVPPQGGPSGSMTPAHKRPGSLFFRLPSKPEFRFAALFGAHAVTDL